MSNFSSLDLHTHIRGTIEYDDIVSLAVKNDISISKHQLQLFQEKSWSSFSEFLEVYHCLGGVVQKTQDWTFLVEKYLEKVAKSGTLYVELMISPTNIINSKISYLALTTALQLGTERAFNLFGIRSAVIITCVRHKGPAEAISLAKIAARHPIDCVVGFGLTGDEGQFSATEFTSAFEIAKQAGLMLTAHTGEWLPSKTVLETVNALNLNRVGHGINVAKDKGILRELIDRKVGFEICLSSNVALNAVESLQSHPFPILYDAGAMISLCADDPSYFGTTPKYEYEIAHSLIRGIFDDLVHRVNSNAIETSFCSEQVKNELCALLKK